MVTEKGFPLTIPCPALNEKRKESFALVFNIIFHKKKGKMKSEKKNCSRKTK